MAGLNSHETSQLDHVQQVLSTVLNEGFSKNSDTGRDKWLAKEIKKAMDEVRTIKSMKGYFPK